MLKQQVEDKAQRTPDSITHDGRTYRRADYEDERRPGLTKVGKLYSSYELYLCGLWDLTSPSGHRFSAHLPVQLTADPSRVSASEAPEPLRRAVSEAEKRYEAAQARVTAALAERAAAEAEQADAAWKQDARRFNTAIVAGHEAEQRRLDAEMVLPPLRVELSRANEKLKWWQDDERMYRIGAAERPEPSAGIF